MTDTTDKLTLQQLKDVRELCLPQTAWRSIIDELISSRDKLEAERQRAAGSEEELHKALHREKAAERKLLAAQEEIAALKVVQVPVAYLIHENAKPARLSFQNLKGFVSQSDVEERQLWQEELFTAPQKLVGLRQIGSIDHDGGEFAEYFVEFTDSAQVGQAVYVIDSTIEAAGGKVES